MSTPSSALSAPDSTGLAPIPEARLQPTTRGRDLAVIAGAYFAAQLVSGLLGLSGSLGLAFVALAFAWAIRRRRSCERALGSGRFAGRTGRVLESWRIVASLAYAHAVIGATDLAHKHLRQADAALGAKRFPAGRVVGPSSRAIGAIRANFSHPASASAPHASFIHFLPKTAGSPAHR